MGYKLGIDTGKGSNAGFSYERLEKAQEDVREAIRLRALTHHQSGAIFFTGPGTVYQIVSDEFLAKPVTPTLEGFLLIVQIRGKQMPPFIFSSLAALKEKAQEAIVSRVIDHSNRPGHDHTFVHLDTGCVLIEITAETFLSRQREALALHMQKQQEQDAMKPRIIVPRS